MCWESGVVHSAERQQKTIICMDAKRENARPPAPCDLVHILICSSGRWNVIELSDKSLCSNLLVVLCASPTQEMSWPWSFWAMHPSQLEASRLNTSQWILHLNPVKPKTQVLLEIKSSYLEGLAIYKFFFFKKWCSKPPVQYLYL